MTPFEIVDAILIAPFRLLPWPEASYYLAMVLLALASTGLGYGCKALVNHSQRARRQRVDEETRRRQELSVEAAKAGNREAYSAQNHLAQEAYNDSMALAAGRGAALLGPGIMVLAWLSWRFEGVSAPGLWESSGVATVFLPLYIAFMVALPRGWRRLK